MSLALLAGVMSKKRATPWLPPLLWMVWPRVMTVVPRFADEVISAPRPATLSLLGALSTCRAVIVPAVPLTVLPGVSRSRPVLPRSMMKPLRSRSPWVSRSSVLMKRLFLIARSPPGLSTIKVERFWPVAGMNVWGPLPVKTSVPALASRAPVTVRLCPTFSVALLSTRTVPPPLTVVVCAAAEPVRPTRRRLQKKKRSMAISPSGLIHVDAYDIHLNIGDA